MKGASAIAIQRLAGHKNLQTTLKYMHLAEGETNRAIALLEGDTNARFDAERGDYGETNTNVIAFPNRTNR